LRDTDGASIWTKKQRRNRRKFARVIKGNEPMDFRQNSPKKFQGKVGACHVFATAELLNHTRFPEIKISKQIDIERTFLEIWARTLGSSLDEAVDLELESLQHLSKVRREHMARGDREGASKTKSFNSFVKESSYFFWLYKQAGTAEFDFDHIQKLGAPLVHQRVNPITIDDLEKMGESIALARLRIMEAETFGENLALSRESRVNMLREAFKPIFQLAQESMKWDRSLIKKELQQFKLESRDFDSSRPSESIASFLTELRSKGPLYIVGNQHATVVVGFEPQKKVFWIRDSDDPLSRDYVTLYADELFNSLKSYYFISRAAK
jgi:hypothetical protein